MRNHELFWNIFLEWSLNLTIWAPPIFCSFNSVWKSFVRTQAPQDLPAMKLTLSKYFDQVFDQKQLLKVVDSLKSRWRAVCILEGDKVQRMRSPERRALGPIPEELLPSDSEKMTKSRTIRAWVKFDQTDLNRTWQLLIQMILAR